MTKRLAKAEKEARRIAPGANQESDWNDIERQVRSLSRYGDEGIRIPRSPEETLAEAGRLAAIYRKADKPLPDTLAALV